jgi:ABC-type amino acid transport substrate-binding protein
VIKKEDVSGSITGNGSWNGMVALVMSGKADIAVSAFVRTKENSKVVAFTDSLGSVR